MPLTVPCTVLTTGECLPFWLCKETVKKSIASLSYYSHHRGWGHSKRIATERHTKHGRSVSLELVVLADKSRRSNTWMPEQNGRHVANVIFKCDILIDHYIYLTKTSHKFVPKSPIDNMPRLVHVMIWRRIGDKLFKFATRIPIIL